jgi:hypothetical protein
MTIDRYPAGVTVFKPDSRGRRQVYAVRGPQEFTRVVSPKNSHRNDNMTQFKNLRAHENLTPEGVPIAKPGMFDIPDDLTTVADLTKKKEEAGK